MTRFMRIAGVPALALSACAGPSAPSGSDTTRAGRYDVSLPGAGVAIGGVLYRPELVPGETAPGLVIVHGHLPPGTNGAATVEGAARRYRDRGYVSLAISMRGWPPSGGTDDCALAQPDDVVQAAEWLRRLPGVDASRIGLIGFSKGGQVVLLAGARAAGVQAIVAFYPPTDLARWKATTSRPETVLYITERCEPPPGVAPRSPVTTAAFMGAPVLLVHGDADENVPFDQSEVMQAVLSSAGRPVQLFAVPGAGHGFTGPAAELVHPVVDAFLVAQVRDRTP